ncbi:MAG: PRC-barrel domain-containing protein [Anaerolineales bacterium]|jgi:uncharacterized protein YrrD
MKTAEGTRLDLPIGANVYAGKQRCGESMSIVLNPVTDEVSDVAVQLNEFGERQVLVPVAHIDRSSEDGIWLDLGCDEIKSMPDFLRTDFIEVTSPYEFAGGPYLMWPYVTTETNEIPVEVEMVPTGELALHIGADVISLEGKVGKVDEFLVDPKSNHISHLVMREGHLWGKRDVLIPVSSIDDIEDRTVKVNLDKQQIEALPEIPVHRSEKWRPIK